jgi:fructuronate reductase
VNRLNIETVERLAESPVLSLPARRSARSTVGVVHLGIGAFHRAHQAVYTEDAALATEETGWGICGVTQRSASVLDQLGPQDGLYGILQKDADTPASLRITGIVREVLDGPTQGDDVLDRLADPAVTVVTLTVTEKGYRRGPDGRLDLADPVVRADVDGAAPASTVGRLVRGLARRRDRDAGPITVLCCDNLNHNGRVVEGLVRDFCRALPTREGDTLVAWIGAHIAFPSSMVDRIVPATTDDDRRQAHALTGLDDEGLVVAEPFGQWVIEDRFAARRPAWELAGAQLTDDVTPYELMKLRILNGSHSTLAYLGALTGHRTIADAVADDGLRDVATALIRDDMIPTLDQPDGVDLVEYGDRVLARYATPRSRSRWTARRSCRSASSPRLPRRSRPAGTPTRSPSGWPRGWRTSRRDRTATGGPSRSTTPWPTSSGRSAARPTPRRWSTACSPSNRSSGPSCPSSAGGGASSSTTSATCSPGASPAR